MIRRLEQQKYLGKGKKAVLIDGGMRVHLEESGHEYYDNIKILLNIHNLTKNNFFDNKFSQLKPYDGEVVKIITNTSDIFHEVFYLIYIKKANKYAFIYRAGLKFT